MVDLTQVLLVIIITVLTVLLSFIGIQIFYILKEIKKTIEKVNKMLDDAGVITESIAQPIAGLGGMLDGLKSSVKAIDAIGSFLSRRKKKEEQEESAEE